MKLIIKFSRKDRCDYKTVELVAGEEREFGRISQKLERAEDPRLSRRHFRIRFDGRAITITHLSQVNATLLGTGEGDTFQKVEPQMVISGDCIIHAGEHEYHLGLQPADSVSPGSSEPHGGTFAGRAAEIRDMSDGPVDSSINLLIDDEGGYDDPHAEEDSLPPPTLADRGLFAEPSTMKQQPDIPESGEHEDKAKRQRPKKPGRDPTRESDADRGRDGKPKQFPV